MGTLQREGRRSIRINPLLVLGVIGLIVLAVFLLRTISNAKDASDDKQDANTNAVVDNLSESEQSAGAAVNTTVVNSGNALDSSGSALGSDSTAVVSADSATLDFQLKDNTQLTIVDATGKTLLTGEQARGGYKLSGKPPFKVQIGNVSNVTLMLNGETIKLNDFATNNQANFSLAP